MTILLSQRLKKKGRGGVSEKKGVWKKRPKKKNVSVNVFTYTWEKKMRLLFVSISLRLLSIFEYLWLSSSIFDYLWPCEVMLLSNIWRLRKKKRREMINLFLKTGFSPLTIDLKRMLCNWGQILREWGKKKERNSCAKLEKSLREWSVSIDLTKLSYGWVTPLKKNRRSLIKKIDWYTDRLTVSKSPTKKDQLVDWLTEWREKS